MTLRRLCLLLLSIVLVLVSLPAAAQEEQINPLLKRQHKTVGHQGNRFKMMADEMAGF